MCSQGIKKSDEWKLILKKLKPLKMKTLSIPFIDQDGRDIFERRCEKTVNFFDNKKKIK